MSSFKDGVPEDFDGPTVLPQDVKQHDRWQKANRSWWESNPMRYDFSEELDLEEFSPGYFDEIDRRFFSSASAFMPYERIPFEQVLDFEALRDKDVLEIGVGCGSHARLLASHARSFSGIDLTDYAIESTTRRMRCFDLEANIQRMDAENMTFPDESFDLIWSWGVIHHSSSTDKILEQMHRVLRPGGRACVMVYHRSFWIYYVMAGFFKGIVQGELFRTRSMSQTLQRWTDGAIARYYTDREWRELVDGQFDVERIRIYGQKNELLPLPAGKFKELVTRAVPDVASRFVTNRLKQGKFLFAEMVKKG